MFAINLVLSGGGARGVAHLGALKALLEHGFEVKAISGASSGAIVGAFFAKGMAPEEILELAFEHADFNPVRFNLGFYSRKNMERILTKYFAHDPFSSLRIPLFAAVTNINAGRTEYLCTGKLVPALVASSALPFLFSPVEINGSQYIDGGVLNNLPVEPFLREKIPLIAVHVNPVAKQGHFSSTLKILERSIELSAFKNMRPRKRYCNLFIEPPRLSQFSVFDFAKSSEMFKISYEFSAARLEKFLKATRKTPVSSPEQVK